MTESDWLTSKDPMDLFRYIHSIRGRSKRGQRRPRRLAVEFWRWQANNLRQGDRDRLVEAVGLADVWAETGVKPEIPSHLRRYFVLGARSWTVARETIDAAINSGGERFAPTQAWKVHLIHELFGNPFRFTPLDPALAQWNDGTILRLAHSIYDDNDFSILPILGDALEEAGCVDAEFLTHCRSPGPHVRGCWVIDRLLAKD